MAREDYDTAERRYTQALEINHRWVGDQARLAISYHQLGEIAMVREDYDTAEQRYMQSLEIEERLGNEAGLAKSYGQLGVLAKLRGDHDTAEQRCTHYDTAEQRYRQARELFESELLDDQAGAAGIYHNLGLLAQAREDKETAEERCTQALRIFERLGNPAGVARSCQTLGDLLTDRNDEQAIGHDLRALSIYMQMRNPRAIVSLRRLACARSRLGVAAFMPIAAQTVNEATLKILPQLLDQAKPATEPRRRRWWREHGG